MHILWRYTAQGRIAVIIHIELKHTKPNTVPVVDGITQGNDIVRKKRAQPGVTFKVKQARHAL